MSIDLTIVSAVMASIITVVGSVIAKFYSERRPKLVSHLGHTSAHKVQNPTGSPINVFTHSIVLINTGKKMASNVRITHFTLPDFIILPDIEYTVKELPNGGSDIVIPSLVPKQMITISYIYSEQTAWNMINSTIRSDEGYATHLTVEPTIPFPVWLKVSGSVFLIFGVIFVWLLVFYFLI